MPDSPVYTHNLASTYFDQEKHTDTKDILQTFNKTYPNHNYIDIHLLLANLYSKIQIGKESSPNANKPLK